MGCLPYPTVTDAIRSLRGGYILYKGKPVYVHEITGPAGVVEPGRIILRLHNTPLRADAGTLNVPLSDPDLDITSMRLGYVNHGNDAYYCSRIPNRVTTQGLTDSNVNCQIITNEGNEMHRTLNTLAHHPSFIAMFENKYPTVQEALTMFTTKERRSCAFHRLFAISKDGFRGDFIVHYRTDKVAYGDVGTGRVTVVSKFKHLTEQLVELGFNV